jgi:hypothetical protein
LFVVGGRGVLVATGLVVAATLVLAVVAGFAFVFVFGGDSGG